MYDPRFPNSYEVLCQNQREEEAAALAAEATRAKANADALAVLQHASRMAPVNSVDALTPEEMHRRRLLMSARMGIEGAEETLKDTMATSAMIKKAANEQPQSVKAKATLALEKLGHKQGQALAPGGLMAPMEIAGPSITGGAGASGLVVPGNLAKRPRDAVPEVALDPETQQKQDTAKKVPKGKPSATLLLRNAVHPEYATTTFTESLRMDVLQECANHGVVRSVKLFAHHSGTKRPNTEDVLSEAERYRILVRFDTVAAAFKAANSLSGRQFDGRFLIITFFSTTLFDKDVFDCQVDEVPIPELLMK